MSLQHENPFGLGAALALLLVAATSVGWAWWQGAKGAYRWAYGADHLWWCYYDEPHAPVPAVGEDGVEPIMQRRCENCEKRVIGYIWHGERYYPTDPADRASYPHVIAWGAWWARVGVVLWYPLTIFFGCSGIVWLFQCAAEARDQAVERERAARAKKSAAPKPPDYSKHEPGSYLDPGASL